MRSERVSLIIGFIFWACVATGAHAAEWVIYVDGAAGGANDGSSWSNAYVMLQDALAAVSEAGEPAEIRVAQGTYRPDEGVEIRSAREATFMLPDEIVLQGGYAGATAADPDRRDVEQYPSILSGSPDSPPPERPAPWCIVTSSHADAAVVLDGFTIARGAVAGVRMGQGSLVVSNCRFEENRDGIDGWAGGDLTIVDCHFVANRLHALDTSNCDVVVRRCLFEGTEHGAAIDCSSGTLAVTDSVFRANNGMGIEARVMTDLDLLRCSFIENTGFNGGGIDCSGTLTARQCSFRSNTGYSRGVGIEARGDVTLIDCDFTGNSSRWGIVETTGNVVTMTRCSFTGNVADGPATALLNTYSTVTRLSHCVFTGNTIGGSLSSPVFGFGAVLRVSNCTFADNRGGSRIIDGMWSVARFTQCIVWNGPEPFAGLDSSLADLAVTFSDVRGGYPGQGNIAVDPDFVRPGYWADPNDLGIELGPDDFNAVWVAGDYHLKSQAGHWDSETEMWVLDATTSPLIDAGDPNGFLGAEPFPNGGYVNLGAYGGTLEASRSYFGKPVCENQIAGDINGDCLVDQTDMDILLSHWLADAGKMANVAPTVMLTSPEDGAELAYPEPIVLRAEASDPDGSVLRVNYTLRAYIDGGTHTFRTSEWDPTDDWEKEIDWSSIHAEGEYTMWATAVDDDGATTSSPEITVTLHPPQ
ncbi:MAG: right-handed parallel beta-helix repeat-containing protein [Sedimentisphaerales bacterium]|nr:right-handed parallel beta-helix repeat-containing protein [Sedimentisphaerales bacterium]